MNKQKQNTNNIEPFNIIRNYRRKNSFNERPRRKVSACQQISNQKQLIIRSRKMTAQIQIQVQQKNAIMNSQQQFQAPKQRPMKVDQLQQYFFHQNDQLQNGIPIQVHQKQDVYYNLTQQNQISSYSKLQKTLFDFGISNNQMQEE